MRFDVRSLSIVLAAASVGFTAASSAHAADPTVQECVAANEQSGPLKQAGKLREARANLLRCSASSCPGAVRNDCIAGATRLDAAVPSVVFVAQDAAGNDVGAVRVTMDGRPFADRLDGTAIDADPGEHTFAFLTSASPPLEKHFILREGEKNRRERIVVGAGSAAAPTRASGAVPAASTPDAVPPPPATVTPASSSPLAPGPASEGSWNGQKTLGVVVGAVGVAGIALGSVFGVKAHASWSDAKTDCGVGCSSSSPAQGEATTAHHDAEVANVAFAAGAAALAGGVLLWVLAPPHKSGLSARLAPFAGQGTGGIMAFGSLP